MVCAEQALDPLRASAAQWTPEVESTDRKRLNTVQDFDSYRRRLQDLQARRDAAQNKLMEKSQEKNSEKNTAALAELQAKVAKYESKVESAGESYAALNHKGKADIVRSKQQCDHLIETLFVIVVTCQVTFPLFHIWLVGINPRPRRPNC